MHAGSTNVNRVARCAAAIAELSTPANVTATPSTNIVVTASQGMGATRVPSVISTAPSDAQSGVGDGAAGPVAGEVDDDQQGDRAEDGEQRCLTGTPTANPTPPAIGITKPARAARRSASNSGSRASMRFSARRAT